MLNILACFLVPLQKAKTMPLSALIQPPNPAPIAQLPQHHVVPAGPELGTVTSQARESQTPSWVKAETHSSCQFSGCKSALLALLFSVVQERWVAIQIGKSEFSYL